MNHNGVPGYVRLVTCDMSLGFQKGIREHLPHARRLIDKFHVVKHANEAVDKVRKAEGRPHAAAAEDRPRVPDVRGPTGHLHGQPHAC